MCTVITRPTDAAITTMIGLLSTPLHQLTVSNLGSSCYEATMVMTALLYFQMHYVLKIIDSGLR